MFSRSEMHDIPALLVYARTVCVSRVYDVQEALANEACAVTLVNGDMRA